MIAAKIHDIARILVVDDEQYMCDICSRTLRSGIHEVVATSSVTYAIEAIEGDLPFDLLLTDIKMPGMSGLELARHAREIDPAIAVIIMTAYASADHLQQAVRSGIADFLAKPFSLEELRLAVDQALNKRRLMQDSFRLRAVEQLLLSSEALNATLNRSDLHTTILRTTCDLTGCNVVFLVLRYPVEEVALPSAERWSLLKPGHHIVQEAFDTGQPIRHNDIDGFCTDNEHPLHYGLAVPLRAHGRALGVLLLCAERPEQVRHGTQEMITLLANQAGIALHNAHLYSELQEAYGDLQELDRLKSEFIAIASHELRTPLSIMLGYAKMVHDQSSGSQHDYTQRVLESANHIKKIVDDMISLRHIDLQEITLTFDACELRGLIGQAVERLLTTADQKAQQIILRLPEQPIPFTADREKVLLVLGNLISNAIKFTPMHGTIEISADLWQRSRVLGMAQHIVPPSKRINPIVDRNSEYWVVVEIRDSGIGIPDRERTRIFKRFYQVADSLTREQGGLGLGLAIVHDLITLQGGTMWFESSEGQGSMFAFALPCHRVE